MRPINLIVIHCSATANADRLYRGTSGKPGFRNPADLIDEWHDQRGFRRSDNFRAKQNPSLSAIGYHFVIARDGLVLTGRHLDEVGAHAKNYNAKSLGICLVGLDQYSPAQWESLAHVVTSQVARLTGQNGPGDRRGGLTPAAAVRLAAERGITILGHRDLPNVAKTCPGFDVASWLANDMQPLEAQL